MKKLFLMIAALSVTFTLFACGVKYDINMTFENVEIGLNSIVFDIELDDPEESITGFLTVDLFLGDERIRTQNVVDFQGLTGVTFSTLTPGTAYRIDVFATVDRDSIKIGTYSFTTLSAETITIQTPEDFMNMKNNRSGNYVLANDLDFTDVEFQTPFVSSFSGTFDGQGYTISNINFTSILTYHGVFGYISTGKIQNFTLDNITIGTEENPILMITSSRVGIIAGYVASTSAEIKNVTVSNSTIHFRTTSTVHAYVGGAVGEHRGKMEDVTLDNVTVSLESGSYGRIKLGGVVGYLYEEATFKRIASNADVNFKLDAANTRDRNFSIIIGGVIGHNLTKIQPRAIDSVYSTGNVTVSELNFNTLDTSTQGTYQVIVGGFAGLSASNIYQGFYSGNIEVNHVKNEHEAVVNKTFLIGGLIGNYTSNAQLEGLLKINLGHTFVINVDDDVTLRASQGVGQNVRGASLAIGLLGTPHLLINGVDETTEDVTPVILDATSFFTSDWIKENLPA
jgi:hypothetical protein